DRPARGRLAVPERQLQRAVAAEARSAAVEIGAQLRHDAAGPDVVHRRRPRVAEHALAVRIGAAADDAAVTEENGRAPRPAALKPGGEVVQRHPRASPYYVSLNTNLSCRSRNRQAPRLRRVDSVNLLRLTGPLTAITNAESWRSWYSRCYTDASCLPTSRLSLPTQPTCRRSARPRRCRGASCRSDRTASAPRSR